MPSPQNFDEDTGSPTFGNFIADVTGTAGGTYTATEQTMINDLKARVNALLAVIKAAGLMQQD